VLATTLLHVPLVVASLSARAHDPDGCCGRRRPARLDTTTLLLAGTIPLGLAMLKTGSLRASSTPRRLHHLSRPALLMSAIYIVAAIVTEVLSNTPPPAATPIVLQLAAHLRVDPQPLLLAVAFGASASFNIPIGTRQPDRMGPAATDSATTSGSGSRSPIVLWIRSRSSCR